MPAPRAPMLSLRPVAVHLDNPRWQSRPRRTGPAPAGAAHEIRNGMPERRNYPLARNTRAESMTEAEAADYLGSLWFDEREARNGKKLERASAEAGPRPQGDDTR